MFSRLKKPDATRRANEGARVLLPGFTLDPTVGSAWCSQWCSHSSGRRGARVSVKWNRCLRWIHTRASARTHTVNRKT